MKAHAVITHAPTQGVTLAKVTDVHTSAPVHPWVLRAQARARGVDPLRLWWLTARNDLGGLSTWFALTSPGR